MKTPLGKRLQNPSKYRKHLTHFSDRRGRVWKVSFSGDCLYFRVHRSKQVLEVPIKTVLHAKLLSSVDTVVEAPRASSLPTTHPKPSKRADVPVGTPNPHSGESARA